MPRTTTVRSLAVAVGAAVALASGGALAQTAVSMTLDWKFEGPAAPYLHAIDAGLFAAEGLEVSIDSGAGSLDAIPKVASGAYEFGFADINSLARFIDQNPDAPVTAIMMVYDAPPFAIISTTTAGVAAPTDLEGRILGAPAPDGAYAQWNAFVAANGIDADAVTIENVGFPVREPMLASGQVDAITGFSFSSFINLRAAGVPEDEIVVMLMSDFGLDLYGNAIIVNTEFAEENPEIVSAFLRAVVAGWQASVASPEVAIQSVLSRNDLADEATEIDRLQMAIADNVLTDAVAAAGIGGVDAARFAASLEQLGLNYDFQTPPDPARLFTDAYLPPAAERMLQ